MIDSQIKNLQYVEILMSLKNRLYYIRDLSKILNISVGSVYNYLTVYSDLVSKKHDSKLDNNKLHLKLIIDNLKHQKLKFI